MGDHGWKGYVGIGIVATLILLIRPDRASVEALWLVLATATAGSVVLGMWLHRPPRRLPWLVLLGALGLVLVRLALAHDIDVTSDGPRRALVGLADLTAHVLIGLVVVLFVRYQTPGRDREAVLDAAIVMIAAATVSWTLTLGPPGLGAETDPLARAFISAALWLAAGVTAVCVRLLFVSRRLPAALLVAASGLALLPATVGWIAALTTDASWAEPVADHLWVVLLTAPGIAALHPSMVELTRPADARADESTRGRILVLGAAVVVTPAALLPAAASLEAGLTLPVAGVATLSLIVVLRLSRLVTDRERARREAGIWAGHEAALSKLAADALESVPLTTLLARAEATIASLLDGAEVVVTLDEHPQEPGAETVWRSVPIPGVGHPVGWIHVRPDADRSLRAAGHDFVAAIANVLAAAAQRREAEDELRHRASHDALTGLPNRTQLFDRIGQALLRRSDGALGLLFLDLDGFKAVNDTYGHAAGDRLLLEVAARMVAAVRVGDTVARLAGDEFVVLLDPCDERELPRIAERLVDAIATPIDLTAGVVEVTTSIGAILSRPDDRDAEELLRRADEAMYVTKQRPGQAIVVAEATT